MGTSTWTGPIRAGNIINTSGTTLGKDVKNVGEVELAQTTAITQTASNNTAYATSIVIPAHSHILNIQSLNSVGWATTNTMTVGTSATANELVPTAVAMTVGFVSLTPGSSGTAAALWDDTGSTDVRIWVKSSSAGSPAGVGTLIVRYLQNHTA